MEDTQNENSQVQELLQSLEKNTCGRVQLYKNMGFWCHKDAVASVIHFQKHFKARDTDIILATLPKSGTTWLAALTFSIINRYRYPLDQSPLLTSHPQSLVRSLELDIYRDSENPNLDHIPDPRIFATHVHYESLPCTIVESKCRIIHICRNPLDQSISLWHFMNMIYAAEQSSLDEFLESYCEGIHFYGPFWKNVLGYWNAHLTNPEKVLFLKYEDLQRDIIFNVKRIAEFIGFPFSLEEEKAGLVEDIANLCSFDKLKGLEVNKIGTLNFKIRNEYLFRRGKVGDGLNYLRPCMIERIENIVEEKFRGSGLKF